MGAVDESHPSRVVLIQAPPRLLSPSLALLDRRLQLLASHVAQGQLFRSGERLLRLAQVHALGRPEQQSVTAAPPGYENACSGVAFEKKGALFEKFVLSQKRRRVPQGKMAA